MEVSTSNVLAFVVPLLALAATWGSLRSRIDRLEKDLTMMSTKMDDKLHEFQASREKQGERIGATEWEIARLAERSGMVTEKPVAQRRRRLTKPEGME